MGLAMCSWQLDSSTVSSVQFLFVGTSGVMVPQLKEMPVQGSWDQNWWRHLLASLCT